MLAHLLDVSVHSPLLALGAAIVLAALQRRRTAALQHAVWAVVVCGMLALFAFGSALPSLALPVMPAARVALIAPMQSPPVPAFTTPPIITEAESSIVIPPKQRGPVDWSEIALVAYAAIAVAFLARFLTGMLLARRLLAKSTPVGGFRESDMITVPCTIGCFRPEILLPLEWREWDPAKLKTVLAHEGSHVRRHDGLIAALAVINRCVFWFHPMAWWLERRLALLAELACDEVCVATTGDPEEYASLLLEMTLVVDASGGRLRGHALTMANGSHIGQRVRAVLKEGRMFSKGVTRMGWAAIVLGGIPLVWAAGAITLDHRVAPLPLPLPPSNSPTPPLFIAQARPAGSAQKGPATPASPTAPVAHVQFEVASVRPNAGPNICLEDKFTADPGRAQIDCASLQRLMEYVFRLPQKQVDGPTWLHHHGGPRFDISAKLPQGATWDQIPEMLRALMVDRFKLVYHVEQREQNVDVLVVGRGGLKLEEVSPLAAASPAEPDAAASLQTVNGILTRVSPSTGARGDSAGYVHTQSRDTIHWDFSSTTLAGLAGQMAERFQRPVVDMTGLKGRYHVVLDVKIDPNPPPVKSLEDLEDQVTDTRNHFNTELQRVGLQLETRKLPVEFVVVDRVEQTPSEN